MSAALADLRSITLACVTEAYDDDRKAPETSGVNQDVVALAQRFVLLMSDYNSAIADGKISITESKHLLRETIAIQQVLLQMKLNPEEEAS